MSIATDLRRSHHDLWEQTVRHPFVLDLGDGTLPREVFHRYMTQDYLFIDALIRLVAAGITKSPPGLDQRPLGAFLSTLLGAEDDLFKRVFADMGTTWPMAEPPTPLASTARLNRLLTASAKKSFAHIVATLYITEGIYADWAQRLANEGRVPVDPLYKGWIDIHANPALADFVTYLDASLESVGAAPGVDLTFERALQLELGFWEAIYPTGPVRNIAGK